MAEVAAIFDRVAERLLTEDPTLARDRIFRSEGLRNAAGRFVAFVADGDLVVKLPAARVDELKATGAGRDFASGSRVMREWVRLAPASEAECRGYVDEARAFAASVPPA
jgi:hypothetical protein